MRDYAHLCVCCIRAIRALCVIPKCSVHSARSASSSANIHMLEHSKADVRINLDYILWQHSTIALFDFATGHKQNLLEPLRIVLRRISRLPGAKDIPLYTQTYTRIRANNDNDLILFVNALCEPNNVHVLRILKWNVSCVPFQSRTTDSTECGRAKQCVNHCCCVNMCLFHILFIGYKVPEKHKPTNIQNLSTTTFLFCFNSSLHHSTPATHDMKTIKKQKK